MKLKNIGKQEKQAANQQLVKEANLTLLFNLIIRRGPVSRAELAQTTGLSPTTVSSLAEMLLQNDMIIETGAGTISTSGRKPIMLEVNSNGGCVAAVEVVEDGFYLALYNLKCSEITGDYYKTSDYAAIGREISDAVGDMLKGRHMEKDKLLGICLGIPGLIDKQNNRVISSTVLPMDDSNNFYYEIKESYRDIPVLPENESCLCAYAEKEFGIGRQVRNLVYIDINVGIGAGIILDGQIYNGSIGRAGEVGHITIDMNGPRCKCGNRGCLEVMAGIPAMSQKIIFAMMSGRDTLIRDISKNNYNRIGIDEIKEAFDRGDEAVVEVVEENAARLAFGINSIINLFSPEAVVIGGEITKLGEAYLERVRMCVRDIGFKSSIGKVDIRYSSNPDNSVTLGGAKYVLDNVFRQVSFPDAGDIDVAIYKAGG